MSITKEEIKHIATLARIGLKEEEINKNQKELSAVLDYFKKLKKVDTKKIDSVGHITRVNSVYRNDNIEECPENVHKQIMKNVPQLKDNQIKVRSVLK